VGDPYDLAVDPAGASRAAIESTLSTPAVGNWFTATDRRGAVGDATFHVRVLGGDVAGAGYLVRSGRTITGPGEAIVGYGLLGELGLRVGDHLPLDISGGKLDLVVVGWYSEMEDSGKIAQISIDDLRTIEPDVDPGGYFAEVPVEADASAVRNAVLAATNGAAKVELLDRSTDELDAFRLAFIMISMLVLAVAFVNLIGTTLVGIRERQRDIGVLKTVGFTPNQIGATVAAGAAAYALLAVVIGVPLGLIASTAMHDAVGRGTGSGPGFGSAPQVGAVAVAAVVLVIGSTALAALSARRAARTSVAEILRSE
jgi:putative ABC transport system permease protein